MTEQELYAKGWRKRADGIWERPKANIQTGCPGENPKLEPVVRHDALGAPQPKEENSGRFLVRVTSFRRRLLDEDNICGKYHIDLCRYAGVLPSDAPGTAKIEISQQKVGPKEREFTRIEIFEPAEI